MAKSSGKKRSVGTATATVHADRLVTHAMYSKGEAFIAAALLLQSRAINEAQHYVVLHLLCQGIEITLKAMLLLIDYRIYQPQLKLNLRHNLRKIADTVLVAAKLHPLRPETRIQLDQLSHFYSKHLLRYGGIQDIFINPQSIPYERVLRRLHAGMLLARRSEKARS